MKKWSLLAGLNLDWLNKMVSNCRSQFWFPFRTILQTILQTIIWNHVVFRNHFANDFANHNLQTASSSKSDASSSKRQKAAQMACANWHRRISATTNKIRGAHFFFKPENAAAAILKTIFSLSRQDCNCCIYSSNSKLNCFTATPKLLQPSYQHRHKNSQVGWHIF